MNRACIQEIKPCIDEISMRAASGYKKIIFSRMKNLINRSLKFKKWHFWLLLSLLLFFSIEHIFAGDSNTNTATGSIEGTVIDKKTGETLIGANVFIEGTTIGTTTDFEGHFTLLNLKPGEYDVKITYVSYNPVIFEGIKVEPVKSTVLTAELEEISAKLDAVTITATRKTNTDISMISAIKASPLVASGITSQQILRSQDRDASEVVKRVPGITIMDDRFIIVRGLNQRYNSVWLNNAATPSSETDVKAFSFDVIPSGLIDNIVVYKSAAPELPADFAGGFIKIYTKNMPDNNFTSVDIAGSYRYGTTSGDFYKYKGGKLDWLGIEDGTRALPGGFPSNVGEVSDPSVIDQYGKALNKNWLATSSKARPDYKVGINLGRRFKINKLNIGNTTSLNYSNSLGIDDMVNNNYGSYITGDSINAYFLYNDAVYTNNVKLTALNNWAFYLSSGNKIEFRNIFNQIGYTRTTAREGFYGYYNEFIKAYEYRFLSRSMYSGQVSGTHNFGGEKIIMEWNLGYAYANRLEPDRKIITQVNEGNNVYRNAIPQFARPRQLGRLYLDNYENIYSSRFDFEHKITLGDFKPSYKTGLYFEYKNREFNIRNIGYMEGTNYDASNSPLRYLPFDQLFTNENIDYYNGLQLTESTSKSDSYTSENVLFAGYFGINIPVASRVNIYGGVRAENNRLLLYTYDVSNNPVNLDNNFLNFFPSVNTTFNFTERSLIRISYAKSINRPEFREIAPIVFFDFNENAGFEGNTNLKDAEIQSVDFRFEHYPSASETFSVALFYKQFTNPIELKYNEVGSGLQYKFENAHKAVSKGIEIELRKSLQSIDLLRNMNVVANASWIESKVIFPENEIRRDRPLFGQSPYIVNTGLYYQNDNGLMVSLLYNVVGPRIIKVGAAKQDKNQDVPDVYEMERHLMDITVSKKFGKHIECKLGVKDLLNSSYRTRQKYIVLTTGTNGETKEATYIKPNKSYENGTLFTFGVSYKF